ncbi:MAG: AMP-binding protein [Nitrospirae bacterium]|nr:AMP-binding protein [Nitrospirota bacterium]
MKALLHHIFIEQAKRQGKKLAFIDCTTNRRISYERALMGALIVANRFKVYKDGYLGIMIPTSAGCALSIIGALMNGKIPVMINYSTGAKENVEYAKRKCNFETVITSRALLNKINCPHVKGMVYIEDIMDNIKKTEKIKALLLSRLPLGLIKKTVHSGDTDEECVILFTSGSERDPKAVQLTHRNILSNIEGFSKVIQLSEEDRILANLPYFHVFGLTVNLWTPIYHGMTIITYANPLDYRRICEIIKEEKPTMFVGTPSFLWGYLRRSEEGDFKSIRLAVCGADKCPDSLREGFLKKHGITLLEGYGTTETSPVISVNTPDANKPGSVGRLIPGVEVKIEDYETGEECPPNKVGRILVRGDSVMKGYLDDLEETSLRLRKGWYDTGDMGYLDEDGFLWHAGRLKRFVKIGGEMVSLVRVENVLEKYLPADVECCVVELPDPVKGARIVVAVTKPINEKEIIKKIAKELPNIALPKHFIVIEDLPKMGSGKIDFRKTTEMVQERLH